MMEMGIIFSGQAISSCRALVSSSANGLRVQIKAYSHVSRAIETGERPIGIDQTNNEGNAPLSPASVIDESCEDKLGGLMGGRD